MDQRLLERIHSIAARYRSVRMWKALALVWVSTAAVGALCWALRTLGVGSFADTPGLLLALGVLASVAVIGVTRTMFLDERWVAQRVEDCFPDLSQRLVTALDQRPDGDGRFGFLQRRVIDEALQHASLRPWAEKTVPKSQVTGARLLNLPAMVLFGLVAAGLLFTKGPETVAGNALLGSQQPAIGNSTIVTIQPGDVDVERGTNLIVVARFEGPVPTDAQLVRVLDGDVSPQPAKTVPMSRSLDDPIFGGSFTDVNWPFTYHVAYDGQQSQSYRVSVFDFPAMQRSDARITYPPYTKMEPKLIEDTHRISAVEGSTIQWRLFLNKRVLSAVLIDGKGRSTYLEPTDSRSTQYTANVELTESRRWELQLVDDSGRTNPSKVELVANVLQNSSPEIKVETARDVRVSPLEEMPVAATIRDDFGLDRFGVSYVFGGDDVEDIVLGKNVAGKHRAIANYLLDFETFDAEADQLLSYYFWAEDRGTDGTVRRTFSDIFFAEVRPFDEIFREGEPPPSGQSQPQQQGQNAQQAEALAELQKEIINATWKVIRREITKDVSSEFASDAKLIRESQSSALQQLGELAESLEDPTSAHHAEEVREHMERAILELTDALETGSSHRLRIALSAEQAAYQSLLKLRAREHEVVRSQQRQSSSSRSSSNSSRQQMQELELDNEQNRYETERQAQTKEQQEEEQQQRDIRQVLSRLGELARRQEDLNRQLKELQSALKAAETDEARDEIGRQLQRLREQEQELLRDVDALADRMDQSANQQEQMQESREQLDQTREKIRRASEALNQQNVSEALSAGTRAERELQRMRDDFRRAAAHEFSQEMREMRDAAQKLDAQQDELGQQIEDLPNAKSGRLRSDDSRDQIREGLQDQRRELDELLDSMQETVQQTEAAEPLLADSLYDSFRETEQNKVDENLSAVDELLRRGFDQQAQEVEEGVSQGIRDLRRQIEQAAENVLGDETEGLRRALGELDQLVRELDNELKSAETSSAESNSAESSSAVANNAEPNGVPRPRRSDREPSEQVSSQPTQRSTKGPSAQPQQPPTQNQPGESQPGESQAGQQSGQQSQSSSSTRSSSSAQASGPSQSPGRLRSQQSSGGGGLAPFDNEDLGGAPLTGDNFREWSDRLRDVEEMVEDPDLRSEAARVRDRARNFRREYKRHSKEPKWDDVRKMVAEPLQELRLRVSQELIRRSAERSALVPIDRDAVPDEFADQVRRYYEQLGSGD